MTGNKDNLINYRSCEGPRVNFGGDGKGDVVGKGDLVIGNIKISNISHVQGLRYNLLSVSQFSDKNCTVEFSNEGCKVIDLTSREVKLTGTRKNNIYVADWDSVPTNTCFVAQGGTETSWLWHKRLSHLNFKTINKLARSGMVEGLPNEVFKKDTICDACLKGKQIKSSFKSKAQPSSTRILNLLHMDLFGPVTPLSLSGRKYTLVVVDDYSRYTWVIFLRKKKDTKEKLPELLKRLETEKELSVTKIRSDRGTEFVNKVISEFCSRKGISHQLSAARTPQ